MSSAVFGSLVELVEQASALNVEEYWVSSRDGETYIRHLEPPTSDGS